MKEISLLAIILFVFCNQELNAQQISANFEVHTFAKYPKSGGGMKNFILNKDSLIQRLNAIPDTTTYVATFVYNSPTFASLDSVKLILINSQAQEVLNSTFSLASLSSNGMLRTDENTVFIKVGAFPYLKRFTAKLTPIHNGVQGAELVFSKTQ